MLLKDASCKGLAVASIMLPLPSFTLSDASECVKTLECPDTQRLEEEMMLWIITAQ